uniref:Uncharacterized protein n=1 Tax=Tolypothrix bouteillei VB521301 TaxID=1479485 RepID=A0A0C1R659_9CYAN
MKSNTARKDAVVVVLKLKILRQGTRDWGLETRKTRETKRTRKTREIRSNFIPCLPPLSLVLNSLIPTSWEPRVAQAPQYITAKARSQEINRWIYRCNLN